VPLRRDGRLKFSREVSTVADRQGKFLIVAHSPTNVAGLTIKPQPAPSAYKYPLADAAAV
jgi:hypothetical protein